MRISKLLGGIFIIAAVALIVTVIYYNSAKRQQAIVFSPRSMLDGIWDSYKKEYIAEGRTVDKQRNNITTSEGQSYSMLRAVWVGDRETFDQVWGWTNANLKRIDSNLFSWMYGQRPNGSYGVLSEAGGDNSASDADTDIAMALLFANVRWGERDYLDSAQAIINDIWEMEVVVIANKPYLAANNLEKERSPEAVIINPSYLSPSAYRLFAQIDSGHDWTKLIDTSYEVIQKSIESPLDKERSINLPPDWILMDRSTAQIKAPNFSNLTSNYSFDAIRLPWRLALDWYWFKEPRALDNLYRLEFLQTQWDEKKLIHAGYAHNGQVISDFESPAVYGGSIGYFLVADSETAKNIYENKLAALYNPDTDSWKNPMSYYDDNWTWFGLALYNNLLPNLVETI
ncbi:MAG: glycosyl hydrolase family 8 [bacterium]|nr:glycosyl hydrolase family 8 [bacterium]